MLAGGNDWIRTSNNLRMKEVDYRCPTLPYVNTPASIAGVLLHLLVCAVKPYPIRGDMEFLL